jgi:threonine dehydratase
MSDLRDQLFQEILMARKRVYAAGRPTPLEHIALGLPADVWIKREDLSPIHAYKWRGAYNRMATLGADERARGVVCASAGNHAQGVALAARRLDTHATIYMPASAPRMKQHAVRQIGGDNVTIVLHGDNYSAAAGAATAFATEHHKTFIHAFDDLATMGGQGTLADEIVMSGEGPFDIAYIQIGGGGMAAAVRAGSRPTTPTSISSASRVWHQASMQAAVTAGAPVELDYVDVFCDGTAVRKVGRLTHALCAELIDEFITVTNEEVCAAIEQLWTSLRCVAEPAGAMGVAGLIKHQASAPRRARRSASSLCANVDFEQLAWISQHAAIGAARRRYFRFEMGETPGGLLHLLDVLLEGVNIVEVQYGKLDEHHARPVIGFEASPPQLALLEQRLTEHGVPHQDVTSQPDVEFRIIQYLPELFHNPYFITLEFPERPGALREFLVSMGHSGPGGGAVLPNLCYFNYTHTGEQVGRALIGFEFSNAAARADFQQRLGASAHVFHELSEDVIHRIL